MKVNSKDKSELKDKIEQFAIENSSESPDMRNEKKGIRYRHQYLATLYDDFIIQNPEIQVSLAVFCSYWPKNIIKPKSGDHAMCTCEKCENPALKLRALKTHKLINHEHELETVMRDIRQDNFESEEVLKEDLKKLLEEPIASKQVRYLEWTKVLTAEVNKNTGKQKQATTQRVPKVALAKDLAIEALADIELLKEHLERNLIIKKKIQEKKEEAIEVDNKAVIQVDWAQNGTIIVPDEAQAAFYGGRFDYSIHTGYQYSKEGSGGFASLSDENDHKAGAIHAALDPKIMELVEKGYDEVTIVSDSPTSQYRNGKNAFLTSHWAVTHGIKIIWIFTESGHGKSPADGIGGNIKNAAQEKQNMKPDTVLLSVKDVKYNLETNIDLKIHTKEDIKNVKENMPEKVGPLVGATKVHELLFEINGNIKKKNLPSDIFYKPVKLKILDAINIRPRVNLDMAFIDEPTEENNEVDEAEDIEDSDLNDRQDDVTRRQDRRTRMRLRRRLATVDDIIAELEDDSDLENDCNDDI